jgi:hypothetical protein
MHAVLVWGHVGLMMVAFGALPLGRQGLHHLLSRVSGTHSAQAVARGFAGIAGVAIEDRWLKRLSRAENDAFATVLHERVPLLAAPASPAIRLFVLWLMITKPA